jgi:arabinogalactan endo-1,4-beta-galactosidase
MEQSMTNFSRNVKSVCEVPPATSKITRGGELKNFWMNNFKVKGWLGFLLLLSLMACHKSTVPKKDFFAKGGDISWLPQMEATGYKFYNKTGKVEDCFKILKDLGFNTVRLRTWVNPSDNIYSGHCSTPETVAMAKRAKSWGMKVMIDFHYSDSWADPGKQVKPAAWKELSFDGLKTAMYDYTVGVMQALKDAGVQPEWVQVGNEIPGGLLLPEGSTDNWPQLAQLLNTGYDAVKKVSPGSKVILHVDQGNNNKRFRWWFDNATNNKVRYDVIGVSYYPYWLEGKPDYTLSIEDLGFNLKDMAARYNKEVMVVEVGGEDTSAQNTYDMLVAVIEKVRAVPGKKGTGVLYWEPEGARSWSRYPLSAWGDDGRPTHALDAFLEK